ncbi:MAG: ABC transporter permease, partial [Oscillospiraceae bacterium]
MKIIDMITLTVGNLWRRKVRTLLTVMGVVVGTCSIVVMISLGVGMDASLQQRLSQMGDLTIIDVYNYGNKPDKK